MLTSNEEKSKIAEVIEAKVDNYLVKPPALDTLKRKLLAIRRKYHLERG